MTLLRRFSSDRRGTVSFGMGLTFTMMLGAVGASIDVARAYTERSQAQRALDAAVVAGLPIRGLCDFRHRVLPD